MNIEEFNSNFHSCIIENLIPGQYHAVKALSNSRMEDFVVSPANYKWYLDNPREDTEAMAFGTLCHTAILEPEELDKRYIARPEGMDFRTKEGKAWKAANEVTGLEVVKSHELVAAKQASKNLYSLLDNNFGAVLEASKKELSIFWQEEETPCKCRLDAYCEAAATMIDIKTTRSAKLANFERDSWNMGFHRKADWYRRGLAAHGLPLRHVLFVAIEKTGPRDFIIYRLQNDIMELGRLQNIKILSNFQQCAKLNEWHGYTKQIQDLSAPTWAIATLTEDELI